MQPQNGCVLTSAVASIIAPVASTRYEPPPLGTRSRVEKTNGRARNGNTVPRPSKNRLLWPSLSDALFDSYKSTTQRGYFDPSRPLFNGRISLTSVRRQLSMNKRRCFVTAWLNKKQWDFFSLAFAGMTRCCGAIIRFKRSVTVRKTFRAIYIYAVAHNGVLIVH